MSRATSSPLRRPPRRRSGRSPRTCRGRGGSRRGRRRASRWRTGCRGRRAGASRVLLRPLRAVVPIGWIGREVDDVEAHRGDRRQPLGRGAQGARSSTARSRGRGTAPSERGKISYQAPNSARSRSTSSAVCRAGADASRAAGGARTSRASGRSVPACSRACGRAAGVAQRRRRRRAAALACSAVAPASARPRSSIRAPSSSISSASTSASTLIVASCTHVPHGSDQPSTR